MKKARELEVEHDPNNLEHRKNCSECQWVFWDQKCRSQVVTEAQLQRVGLLAGKSGP